jgi:hypothetical protein
VAAEVVGGVRFALRVEACPGGLGAPLRMGEEIQTEYVYVSSVAQFTKMVEWLGDVGPLLDED